MRDSRNILFLSVLHLLLFVCGLFCVIVDRVGLLCLVGGVGCNGVDECVFFLQLAVRMMRLWRRREGVLVVRGRWWCRDA